MERPNIDFDETFEMIRRNLEKADEKSFRYLIYPNDIQNLLSLLFKEYHDMASRPFRKPALLDAEEITGYKFSKGNFPDFMNDFLAENEDRFPNMSMREMEDALMGKFYAEVIDLGNAFLVDYFAFKRSLNALAAAFHSNAYDFLSPPKMQDADRFYGQVGPDRSPSASLTKDYPYLEELMKVLSEKEPGPIERFMDRILWDFLEGRYKGFFSSEEVFAYTVKLEITQRWTVIDAQSDGESFDQLLEKIKNNVRSPKTPVI